MSENRFDVVYTHGVLNTVLVDREGKPLVDENYLRAQGGPAQS